MQWLLRSWFLVSLVILLPCGMLWGWSTTAEWRQVTFGHIHPAVTTVLILFLMSFSLDGTRLRDAFRSPRPVVWGTLVNIGIMPLMVVPIIPLFSKSDFALGLMIAAAVPCTLATASVSTRQAGGNDAVSLLITLMTNFLSVVLTPYWLKWTISIEAEIDPYPIIGNLALTVLLPTIAGQWLRAVRPCRTFAAEYRTAISVIAQCLVLLIVTKAAVDAGGRLQLHTHWPAGAEFAGLALACGGIHLTAMLIAEAGGRFLRLSRVDRIATVFAGSQKTLPVGLLLAAMPAVTGDRNLPFVTFPILLFHAVQLVMDTAIASRIAAENKSEIRTTKSETYSNGK